MTYGELERMVYDLMGVTTPPWPLQVRVKSLLNQKYLRVVAESHLSDTRANLAFVAGVPEVSLPAGFLEVRSIRAGGVVLRMASDAEFAALRAGESAYGAAAMGPQVWVLKDPGQILVWPAPTESTLTGAELLYASVVTKMSLDTDVPAALPEPWHDLLAWMVLSEVGGTDQEKMQAASIVGDMRGGLVRHLGSRGGRGAGRIKLTGYPSRG